MYQIPFSDLEGPLAVYLRQEHLPCIITLISDPNGTKPKFCIGTGGDCKLLIKVPRCDFINIQSSITVNQGQIYGLLCSILNTVDANFVPTKDPEIFSNGSDMLDFKIVTGWKVHFSESGA